MTSPLSLLLLGALLGGPGQAEPRRITVPPITTDDHSYRSWLGTAELGDVVVANLGTLPDVALIERTDLGKIEGERALASAGLSSLTAMPPLQGAEWSVTIHLGEARENRRPLDLGVFSLARDQMLIRTNFDLAVPLRSRLSGDATLAGEIAARVREALAGAHRFEARQAGLHRAHWFTKPLWPEPPGWLFIRPEANDGAIRESELNARGLIRDASARPGQAADFLVWEPRPGVLEVGNVEAGGLFPTNSLPSWQEVMGRLRPPPAASEAPGKRASAALLQRAKEKLSTVASLGEAASRTNWRDGLSLLGHVIRLDPGRVEAQELLLRATFAPWVGRESAHPLRWRYWRRDAWGEQVRLHGWDTRAAGQIDEELDRAEFRGEFRSVAWHYVHSAYKVVRTYAAGQGFGPRDRWPADLDSQVLERWWGRDLAELRNRLERTAGDTALAGLRLACANEILVYGAGPDAAGWCRWLEKHAPDLRQSGGDTWNERGSEVGEQLRRLYGSAGRTGEHAKVLSVLTASDANGTARSPTQTAPRLHLPHVSQLDSLAFRPALDAGEVELGPTPLTNAVRTLRLPPRTAILGLIPLARGERWLLAEVPTEVAEERSAALARALTPLAGPARRLLRSRRDGQFELVPNHPLLQSTVGITGHRGELWGFTRTSVWRIASGREVPQPAAEGLTGPVFGLHSVAGHLLASGQGIREWRPEEGRWASLVSMLPARGPGEEVSVAFQPGNVWVRRAQSMRLPPGGAQAIPEALNPPWHAWESGRWTPLSHPRTSHLLLDVATNAWCVEHGSLRLLSPGGTNLWPEVALRNPVVWRDPWAITLVGEPLPAYLQSREGPPHISPNDSGFDTEYTATELESLRLSLTRRPKEGSTGAGSSRLNDPVSHLALVGDHLWLATHRNRIGKAPVTRVALVHAPTRRWIAAADLPGPLKHMSAGSDGILAVTGDRQGFNREPDQVHAIDLRGFLTVPESAWLAPDPSAAEVADALRPLTVRQRALRAWSQGDPRPIQALLAGIEPDTAAAEDLFLLATSGADEARRRQAVAILRRDHPHSLFAAALRLP